VQFDALPRRILGILSKSRFPALNPVSQEVRERQPYQAQRGFRNRHDSMGQRPQLAANQRFPHRSVSLILPYSNTFVRSGRSNRYRCLLPQGSNSSLSTAPLNIATGKHGNPPQLRRWKSRSAKPSEKHFENCCPKGRLSRVNLWRC